jgi:hypothetical protein
VELPTSPDAYGDSIKIDPTEDFGHANKFYVLTDKPELVYIMTDQVLLSFGNFWRPPNAIIFKGLSVLFCFPPGFDVYPEISGRLRGGGIVKASLRGTYCGFCKRLPVSTVPRASRDRRGLPPIIIQESWMGWECLIDCLPMHNSVDFGLCVCTGRAAPDNPVRCDVIIRLTASSNTDLALGPLTTNV